MAATGKKKTDKTRAAAEGFTVPGFRAAGISCGIKKGRARDLALIVSDVPAAVAGVFTTNRVQAAPVVFDRRRVRKGASRGVVINSGNANACTGKAGYRATGATAAAVEAALGLSGGDMLVCSTGVIGVPLPVEKIEKSAPRLAASLSPDGFCQAAEAMMTTDAFPKTAVARARIGGRTVTVGGVAKGAGMIRPDMATMLAFLVTDATVAAPALGRALAGAVDLSFNSIAVDNDSSTNDTVLAFANGASG
ncbi:MAG: bifunctional ornithine acetyltransferase/N-acetylglutamate synthase, partial [Thermodesulfobacteriota bacterium]